MEENESSIDGSVNEESRDLKRSLDDDSILHESLYSPLDLTSLLPSCNRISIFLQENGYPAVKVVNSDVDPHSRYER
jgi:hypothetical protein